MSWLNGKDVAINASESGSAGASAETPAAAAERATALVVANATNGITTELTCFIPVKDIQQAIIRRVILARRRLANERRTA